MRETLDLMKKIVGKFSPVTWFLLYVVFSLLYIVIGTTIGILASADDQDLVTSFGYAGLAWLLINVPPVILTILVIFVGSHFSKKKSQTN